MAEGLKAECVMTIADDLRRFADVCHKMALATNKSEWDDLAERWLHCIPSLERAANEITSWRNPNEYAA